MIASTNGPRNSSAVAVPSANRSSEAMKNNVIAALTQPSTTHIPNVRHVNADGRGRTTTSSRMPASESRSHAVPSEPI